MKQPTSSVTDTINNFIKRGDFLLRENQLEAAEKIYQQIHEQIPDQIEALYGLGVIAFQRDQRHAAELFFNEVLSYQAKHQASLEYLALMAFEEQEWTKAKNYIDQLIQLDPSSTHREQLNTISKSLAQGSLAHAYTNEGLIIKTDYLDILKRMGDYYYEHQDYVRAEGFYKRALLIQPNQINCLISLGLSKHQRGDQINSLRYSEMVLKLQPDNIDAKNNIKQIKQEQEQISESEQYYLKSFKINPTSQAALDKLGLLYDAQRDYEKAKRFYERSLLVNPNVVKTLSRLAQLYDVEGNPAKAKQYYQQILSFEPNQVHALNQLGSIVQREGNLSLAEDYFLRALAVNDHDINTFIHLAKLYTHQHNRLEAERWCQKILKLNPNDPHVFAIMGQLASEQSQYDQAVTLYEKALKFTPENTEFLEALALTYKNSDRFTQATQVFKQALDAYRHLDRQNLNRVRIQLNEESCRYQLSLVELLQGDFSHGLENYHARKSISTYQVELPNFIPSWNGHDPLQGKTVYLFNEMGLAELILFLRFAEHLKAQEARVIVYCGPYWQSLIRSCPWVDGVVTRFTEIDPSQSYQILASDLPYYFDLRLETIPNTTPYLTIRETNQAKTSQHENKLRMGIAWVSDTDNPSAGTLRLEVFSRLFRQSNLEAFGLCPNSLREDIEDQVNNELLRFRKYIKDTRPLVHSLEELAELINQMDIIITADSAVAHIAGAMNKTCYLLLPPIPTWYWFLERNDSPWYPSIHVLRKGRHEAWEDVARRLQTQLANRFRVNARRA